MCCYLKNRYVIVGPEDLLVMGCERFFLPNDDTFKNIPVILPLNKVRWATLERKCKQFQKHLWCAQHSHVLFLRKFLQLKLDGKRDATFFRDPKTAICIKSGRTGCWQRVLIISNLQEPKMNWKFRCWPHDSKYLSLQVQLCGHWRIFWTELNLSCVCVTYSMCV